MALSKRIDSLDSLRGLASLSVVIDHSLLTLPVFFNVLRHVYKVPLLAYLMGFSPLHILWAGHEAVILFYVLSGFVLALPYVNGRAPSYIEFLVKRVCRIYIPYIVVVLLSAGILWGFAPSPVPGLSTWFSGMWSSSVTSHTLWDLTLMLGRSNHNIDTATWSLVHEMRISLVFPWLFLWVNRSRAKVVAAGVVFLSGIGVFGSRILPLPQTLYDTSYYAAFFMIGIILAMRQSEVIQWFTERQKVQNGLLGGLALCLYLWTWLVPNIRLLNNVLVSDWAACAGSAIFIGMALCGGSVSKTLTDRKLLWLGRISYSLYLIHPIVLLVLVHSTYSLFPSWVAVAMVPAVSLGGATVVYHALEAPAQRLGKRLSAVLPLWLPPGFRNSREARETQ